MMSPVSGRDSVAPHPDRPLRELLLHVLTCVQDVQPEVSLRLGSRVAPSLAMSNDVAAERGSQPAQRDELAHSHTVPIDDGISPLTIDNPPNATTGILESLQSLDLYPMRKLARTAVRSYTARAGAINKASKIHHRLDPKAPHMVHGD